MKNRKGLIFLLIAAVCWGAGYVSQSFGLRHLGPLAMVCTRYIVATAVLLPTALRNVPLTGEGPSIWRRCAFTGFITGLPMAAAMILQQMGLGDTGAGKGAFLSSLYIIITPIMGLFLRKKVRNKVWAAVAIALLGSYFLCVTESFTLGQGDIYVLLCALLFSVQIHIFEKVGDNGYPIIHSFFAELTVCVTSFVLMLTGGQVPDLNALKAAFLPILFTGIVAGSIADTCAVIGQRESEPSVAPLVMSLESVFGVLFGILILHETLTMREVAGCVLIFAGVLIAQMKDR